MSLDTRELFARLIQCEAGGEGDDGMRAVATVIMNRATIDYGEFAASTRAAISGRLLNSLASLFVCGKRWEAATIPKTSTI